MFFWLSHKATSSLGSQASPNPTSCLARPDVVAGALPSRLSPWARAAGAFYLFLIPSHLMLIPISSIFLLSPSPPLSALSTSLPHARHGRVLFFLSPSDPLPGPLSGILSSLFLLTHPCEIRDGRSPTSFYSAQPHLPPQVGARVEPRDGRHGRLHRGRHARVWARGGRATFFTHLQSHCAPPVQRGQ